MSTRMTTGALLGRGVLGGLVGGVVFIVPTMWFASTNGSPAAMPFKLISTLLLGDSALQSGDASVPLGILVHAVLSIAFGLGFALIAQVVRGNGSLAMVGIVYGAALFVLNFLILAPALFTAFTNPNKPFELFAHLVFGAVVALFFFGPQPGERLLPGRRAAAASSS